MVRIERCIGIGAVAFAALAIAAGCGGSDSPKNDSFAGISESIAKPTGTVDATTVGKIGAEFDKTNSAGAGAASSFASVRGDEQVAAATGTKSYNYDCPQGGTISATGTGTSDGNQASGHVEEHLDKCCYTAGCCASGDANLYFSGSTSSASGGSGNNSVTANYSLCMNVNVATSCNDDSFSGTFSGCLGAGGSWTYNIEVDGKTFSVSGDYASGSGKLTIQGANGSWDCTYSSGSGTCTGPNDDTFSFSSSS
ncbi:MAG TPA: hypothetical protein VG963_00785 [Polyangiaceae bacterium]|nr:hypothetical protein [Polyangiaceae bacterium]